VICYAFIFAGLSLLHIPVRELVNLTETYLVFFKINLFILFFGTKLLALEFYCFFFSLSFMQDYLGCGLVKFTHVGLGFFHYFFIDLTLVFFF
jgi:hypothetical protein